jgi:hypothetical protein
MPILLWLLGVPVTLVLVLWFFGIVGFYARVNPLWNACAPLLPIRRRRGEQGLRNLLSGACPQQTPSSGDPCPVAHHAHV